MSGSPWLGRFTYTVDASVGSRSTGWQVKQQVEGLDPAAVDAALGLLTPLLIDPRPSAFLTTDQAALLPRRLLWTPLGQRFSVLAHTVYAGPDASGRPDNAFHDVLIALRDEQGAGAGLLDAPVDAWDAPFWLTPFGSQEVSAASFPADVLDAAPGTRVSDALALDFVLDLDADDGAPGGTDRVAVLLRLLDALELIDDPRSGVDRVVVLVDRIAGRDAAGPLWIAAALMFATTAHRRRTSFSTYQAATELSTRPSLPRVCVVSREQARSGPLPTRGWVVVDTASAARRDERSWTDAAGRAVDRGAWARLAHIAFYLPPVALLSMLRTQDAPGTDSSAALAQAMLAEPQLAGDHDDVRAVVPASDEAPTAVPMISPWAPTADVALSPPLAVPALPAVTGPSTPSPAPGRRTVLRRAAPRAGDRWADVLSDDPQRFALYLEDLEAERWRGQDVLHAPLVLPVTGSPSHAAAVQAARGLLLRATAATEDRDVRWGMAVVDLLVRCGLLDSSAPPDGVRLLVERWVDLVGLGTADRERARQDLLRREPERSDLAAGLSRLVGPTELTWSGGALTRLHPVTRRDLVAPAMSTGRRVVQGMQAGAELPGWGVGAPRHEPVPGRPAAAADPLARQHHPPTAALTAEPEPSPSSVDLQGPPPSSSVPAVLDGPHAPEPDPTGVLGILRRAVVDPDGVLDPAERARDARVLSQGLDDAVNGLVRVGRGDGALAVRAVAAWVAAATDPHRAETTRGGLLLLPHQPLGLGSEEAAPVAAVVVAGLLVGRWSVDPGSRAAPPARPAELRFGEWAAMKRLADVLDVRVANRTGGAP